MSPPDDPPHSPIKALLPRDVLAHLVPYGTLKTYQQGEVIFELASPGSTMFIIEQGTVTLVFAAGTGLKQLGPGEFFGELALISGNQRRTATAIVSRDTVLRTIDQRAFEELMQRAPQVSVQLLRATCAYLLESEQGLVQKLSEKNRELVQTLDYLRRTKQDLDTTEILAQTDELTGLYNRRCLKSYSALLLAQADRDGLGLILIDIDRFKEINDEYGHAVGDHVLKRFSEALSSTFRKTDLPIRIGGDEFAVLQSQLHEPEAQAAAGRFLNVVRGLQIELAQQQLQVNCSIGGSWHRPGEGWASFFDRTDQSLYLAKNQGRNRLAWEGRVLPTSVAQSSPS